MKNYNNTFDRGINSDTEPNQTPSNVMTNCTNLISVSKEDSQLVEQRPKGNIEKFGITEGYIPVAVKSRNGIVYIMSYKKGTESLDYPTIELGSFPGMTVGEDSSEVIDSYRLETKRLLETKREGFYITQDLSSYDKTNFMGVFGESNHREEYQRWVFYNTTTNPLTFRLLEQAEFGIGAIQKSKFVAVNPQESYVIPGKSSISILFREERLLDLQDAPMLTNFVLQIDNSIETEHDLTLFTPPYNFVSGRFNYEYSGQLRQEEQTLGVEFYKFPREDYKPTYDNIASGAYPNHSAFVDKELTTIVHKNRHAGGILGYGGNYWTIKELCRMTDTRGYYVAQFSKKSNMLTTRLFFDIDVLSDCLDKSEFIKSPGSLLIFKSLVSNTAGYSVLNTRVTVDNRIVIEDNLIPAEIKTKGSPGSNSTRYFYVGEDISVIANRGKYRMEVDIFAKDSVGYSAADLPIGTVAEFNIATRRSIRNWHKNEDMEYYYSDCSGIILRIEVVA